jgi:hypothetical protein
MRYGIARKPTPRLPSGRAIGHPKMFETREAGEAWLARKAAEGWSWANDMHVVETDGSIGVEFPPSQASGDRKAGANGGDR